LDWIGKEGKERKGEEGKERARKGVVVDDTFSRVSLPICTMASAMSTQGIRPEKEAPV
jgi:hypothetical protein